MKVDELPGLSGPEVDGTIYDLDDWRLLDPDEDACINDDGDLRRIEGEADTVEERIRAAFVEEGLL
jgi:hypothetical protein